MCIKNLLLRAQNVNFLLEDVNLFPTVTICRIKNNFIFSLVVRQSYNVVGKRTMTVVVSVEIISQKEQYML